MDRTRFPDMYRYRFNAAGTLAASAFLTVAANLGMHAVYSNEDVPAANGHITPDFERQIVPEVMPVRFGFDLSEMSNMPYAPNFSYSRESRQVDNLHVGKLVNRLGDLANTTGVEIDRVTIQGRASDEAGNGPDAGLGEQNQQNLRLAETRAYAFEREFSPALKSNDATRSLRVEVLPPQEQILSDEMVAELRHSAGRAGISLAQAVHRFNHGGELPGSLRADLEESLQNRGVHVYVEGSKMVPTPFAIANEHQPEPQSDLNPQPEQKPQNPLELPVVPVVLPVSTRRKYPYGDILPDINPTPHKNTSPVGPGGEPFATIDKDTAELSNKFQTTA